MKKVLTGIVTMGLVLSVGSTTAFATGINRGRNFVDADNNGICDYYDESCEFVDADGDGICDTCGIYHRCGMGGNFVDADGDGICDNYATGQGRGNGRANGTQGGCGRYFVDADGDGICDNYVTGQGQGNGCGRGNGGRGNGFRGGRSK